MLEYSIKSYDLSIKGTDVQMFTLEPCIVLIKTQSPAFETSIEFFLRVIENEISNLKIL